MEVENVNHSRISMMNLIKIRNSPTEATVSSGFRDAVNNQQTITFHIVNKKRLAIGYAQYALMHTLNTTISC